jgi:hypothetical protein
MRDHVARPRDRRVAVLLAAAAAPAERPVPGEGPVLAAYRDAMALAPASPRSRMQSRTTVKLAAASAIGALSLLGGGYAVAATGSLPGAAQQTAKDALANVGVTVPGPADAAAEETATREGGATAGTAATGTESSAKGDAVSDLATTTDLEGADKGAAASGPASDGRSKAGARPTPSATTTTTAAEADENAAAGSAATGEQASDGRSTARTGNAGTHRP